MPDEHLDFSETHSLQARYEAGDEAALGEYIEGARERLRRMLSLRMDRRVRGRIDASDIIQDTFVEAAQRLEKYLRSPDMPLYLWIRFLANQKLLQAHRAHFGKQRDAAREISLDRANYAEATSAVLAERLAGEHTSPTHAARKAEFAARLEEALNAMLPTEREVIALRHFEHLSNAESARVLGLEADAASKRYLRALRKLSDVLGDESPV